MTTMSKTTTEMKKKEEEEEKSRDSYRSSGKSEGTEPASGCKIKSKNKNTSMK